MKTKLEGQELVTRNDFIRVFKEKTYDEIVKEFRQQDRMDELVLFLLLELNSLGNKVESLVELAAIDMLSNVDKYLVLEPDLLPKNPKSPQKPN